MMYEEIIHSMTLEDKIALCSGKDFWHTKDFKKYTIFLLKLCVKRLKANSKRHGNETRLYESRV